MNNAAIDEDIARMLEIRRNRQTLGYCYYGLVVGGRGQERKTPEERRKTAAERKRRQRGKHQQTHT